VVHRRRVLAGPHLQRYIALQIDAIEKGRLAKNVAA
jgi:hypothetical protein